MFYLKQNQTPSRERAFIVPITVIDVFVANRKLQSQSTQLAQLHPFNQCTVTPILKQKIQRLDNHRAILLLDIDYRFQFAHGFGPDSIRRNQRDKDEAGQIGEQVSLQLPELW